MSGEDLSLFYIESSSDQISNSGFIKIIFLAYFQHAIEIYSFNLAKFKKQKLKKIKKLFFMDFYKVS